jgi:hypothetical protein
MEAIGGWLLVYLIGSVPMTLFYATGLAGRFFAYHVVAIAGIFVVLAAPLVLIPLKFPAAPAWNIAALWVGAGSISMVMLLGATTTDPTRLREVGATLVAIAIPPIVWAVIWTIYFLNSERVARAFT